MGREDAQYESLPHVRLGKVGKPLRMLQLTDLHHFPEGVFAFTPPITDI
jgi:hypothetical protein